MARLILALMFVAAIIIVGAALGRVMTSVTRTGQEALMPDTVKTISYVLLIVLMLGVVSGWLGGL